MPTSVTGNWTKAARVHRLARGHTLSGAGFTLLEVMAVIFIMAILTSLALLATSDGERDDRELRREAERLAIAMEMASEDAVLRSLELGLMADREGYRFVVLEDNEWLNYGGANRALRPHRFPEGVDLVIESEGFEAELTEEDDDTTAPQIIFLSSGEQTPFVLRLGRVNEPPLVVLEGDAAGNIEQRSAAELSTARR